jgi:predicted CxxxxCH...CXXCH cytochrome family protein
VDGTQDACGTCHGLPPGGTHFALTRCSACHAAVIRADRTFVAPALHVNGIVEWNDVHPAGWYAAGSGGTHGPTADSGGVAACTECHGADLRGGGSGVSCDSCHSGWQTNCTFCHGGTDNMTGAPPEGVDGETARTTLEVGAHTSHVATTTMHSAFPCSRCHVTPASALSAGHIDGDGTAEITFDTLNTGATYNFTTGVCANLYCHGNGWSTRGTADWDTDPTLNCASCHNDETTPRASFTMSGDHRLHVLDRGYRCNECHSTVVSATKTIIGLSLHVNGTPDVSFRTGGTWTASTNRCSGLTCHGNQTW